MENRYKDTEDLANDIDKLLQRGKVNARVLLFAGISMYDYDAQIWDCGYNRVKRALEELFIGVFTNDEYYNSLFNSIIERLDEKGTKNGIR